MTDLRAFSSVIEAAQTTGDALVIFDVEDRIIFANERHREIYDNIDHDKYPTFTDVFWSCVKSGRFDHPLVYEDPKTWLADTLRGRLEHPSVRFLRRHRDGSAFVIRNVRVDGIGSYQTRTSLSPTMATGVVDFCSFDPSASPQDAGSAAEIADLRNRVADMTAALDAWRAPCALISDAGQVRHFNHAMSLLLDQEDGLRLAGPSLQADFLEDHKRLLAKIKRYAHTRAGSAVATMRVRRNSGRPPLVVSINATTHGLAPLVRAPIGSVIVLVADPDSACAVDARTLRHLYDLTEFQADLATRLVRAESLSAIAADLGTSEVKLDAAARELMVRMGVDTLVGLTQCMCDIAGIIRPHRNNGW